MGNRDYTPIIRTRKCSKCGRKFPQTADFFQRDNNRRLKVKLRAEFKICRHENDQIYSANHKKEIAAYNRLYREKNFVEIAKKNKAWQKENRAYLREYYKKYNYNRRAQARDWRLRQNYGISLQEYNDILEAQGGVCAICGKTPEEHGRALCIDHNHHTGKIRGVVCTYCNHKRIGALFDNKQVWAGMMKYIAKALKEDKKWR